MLNNLTYTECGYIYDRLLDRHPEMTEISADITLDVLNHEMSRYDITPEDAAAALLADGSPEGSAILEKITGVEIYRARPGESGLDEPVTQPAMTRQAWAAACIEKITGVEICQDEPVTQPPATTGDDRIIVSVSPNPKRQGSAAYDRYQRYQAGITVEAAIARGVTRADIRYDLKRGFIALG